MLVCLFGGRSRPTAPVVTEINGAVPGRYLISNAYDIWADETVAMVTRIDGKYESNNADFVIWADETVAVLTRVDGKYSVSEILVA